MRTSIALRLALLFMCLVAVVWSTTAIRKGGVVGLFASLGADVGDPNYLQICPRRIHSFTWPDGKRIEEIDKATEMEWRAYDFDGAEPRGLNYLTLEKWLSANCLTRGSAGPATQAGAAVGRKLLVTLTYTNGNRVDLQTLESDPNTFAWNGRLIQAHILREAFDALRTEAGWDRPQTTPIPATSSGH